MYLDVITKIRQPADLALGFAGLFLPIITLVEHILYKNLLSLCMRNSIKYIENNELINASKTYEGLQNQITKSVGLFLRFFTASSNLLAKSES